MKKPFLFFYALSLAGAMSMISCNKVDDDEPQSSEKQIKAYVYQEVGNTSRDSIVFTYNSNGTLKVTENFEITGATKTMNYLNEFGYQNDKLVTITYYEMDGTAKLKDSKDSIAYDSNNRPHKIYDFNVNNGKFVLSNYVTTISYNADNLPSKIEENATYYDNYEYTNKNLTKITAYENGVTNTSNYSYDSKKNPFKNNPYFFGQEIFYSTNNYISSSGNGYTHTLTYEYNSEDYPTKITTVSSSTGGTPSTVIKKIYYK